MNTRVQTTTVAATLLLLILSRLLLLPFAPNCAAAERDLSPSYDYEARCVK
jgi:hypothetical protein